jgi:hypothetical protein
VTAISWWHAWPSLSDGRLFPDIGGRRNDNPALEILQTLSLSWLYGLYLYVLARWSGFELTPRAVALMALGPALLMLAALPVNSNDVFGYISTGRVAVVHGANPYAHTYSEFADDFSRYVSWDVRMSYGPLMLLPFMLAAWVSVHSVLLAIVALKAMWLLTHACTCAVLYRMLKGWRGDPAFGLFLVAMNPLILLEQITNGHNDGLMTLAGLLAVWAVQRERFVAGLLLALLAALVKLPGAFFGAAILVYLVRRGEWRRAAVGVAACVALTIPVAIILFPDVDAVRPTTLSGFYLTNSFHVLSLEGLSRHGARWGVQTGIEDLVCRRPRDFPDPARRVRRLAIAAYPQHRQPRARAGVPVPGAPDRVHRMVLSVVRDLGRSACRAGEQRAPAPGDRGLFLERAGVVRVSAGDAR